MLLVAYVTMAATTAPQTCSQAFLSVVRANDCAGPAAARARSFIVGDAVLGKVLPRSAEQLARFEERFEVTESAVRLRDDSAWVDGDLVSQRSAAVAAVVAQLRDEDAVPALRGWRDEAFAIRSSFHAPPDLLIERAAAPLFGGCSYGVFVNGYVCDGPSSTPSKIWLGRRAHTKPTWPGLLDCVAAGGIAAGALPVAAMQEECGEEAGIMPELAACAQPAGGVSYTGFNEDGWGLKQDVLFTFDLQLPASFEPTAVDGEVSVELRDGMDRAVSLDPLGLVID